MHVCHLCDSSVGGDYFRNIAIGMTGNGARVTLVELGRGEAPAWLADVPGGGYYNLGAEHKWQYPLAVFRLARFLRANDVDILQTHLFYSGLIGVLAIRFARQAIVALMRHHTGVVRMLGSQLHIAADKWMAKKADHVLTVSRAARDYMVNVDQIDRDDIEVIYLGFDFDKYSPNPVDRVRVRDEFGFSDDDFVIGYVANFAGGKGHVQLIEAFKRVLKEIPNARLFFAGSLMLDEVRLIASAFEDGRIVFAGWRSDISACLNAMDLFVQPSLSEAFSQVLIEAMGVGLPVIATDVGGASEVIENGVDGIVIEPGDADAISREVLRLYRDTALRGKLADAGMATVRKRFTSDIMVKDHLALYTKWLDARRDDH